MNNINTCATGNSKLFVQKINLDKVLILSKTPNLDLIWASALDLRKHTESWPDMVNFKTVINT